MALSDYPIKKAFMLMEPGPVVLVTTRNEGRNNLMTLTWHMVMDFTPHIAFTTGPWNYSFQALEQTRECVLAVPTVDLAEKVVSIGDCTGSEVDKFEKFRLTPLPAAQVQAPLVAECLACIECRIVDFSDHGIIIAQGVHAWMDAQRKERRTFHANGDGTFVTDGETLNLRNFMEDKIPQGV